MGYECPNMGFLRREEVLCPVLRGVLQNLFQTRGRVADRFA